MTIELRPGSGVVYYNGSYIAVADLASSSLHSAIDCNPEQISASLTALATGEAHGSDFAVVDPAQRKYYLHGNAFASHQGFEARAREVVGLLEGSWLDDSLVVGLNGHDSGTKTASEGSPRLGKMPKNVTVPSTPIWVRFDDGQIITVVHGLIVGRNPRSRAVPDDYVTGTVRGPAVSRRHWMLRVAHGTALISDLGSSDGTTVEASDGNVTRLRGTLEVAVPRGTTIKFAGRFAVLE